MDSKQKAIIVRYLNGRYSAYDRIEIARMLSNGIDEKQWKELLEEQKMPDIVPAEEKMEGVILERIKDEISKVNEGGGAIRRRIAVALAASVVLVAGLWGYQRFGTLPERLTPQKLVKRSSSTAPTFLVMEDQSEIWINSKSTIHYPTQFSRDRREVMLKGQAFFKVRKEKKRQFVVHAGELDIKVLGTTFDVKSYPEEEETVITLLSGKVEVELAGGGMHVLLPNQRLIFDKTTKMVMLRNIKAHDYVDWREGEIIFTNLPLAMIAKGLERKFNKRFVMDDSLKNRLITLKVKNGGLMEVLEILSHSADLKYSIRGEEVILSKN